MKVFRNSAAIILAAVILTVLNIGSYAAAEPRASSDIAHLDCLMASPESCNLNNAAHINKGSRFKHEHSGMIVRKTLSLNKSKNFLVVNGNTICGEGIRQCGFTYIKVQQYKNGKWVDYRKYNNIYSDSKKCTVKKTVRPQNGYRYRAIAQHYAKKNAISKERIVTATAPVKF